LKINYASNGNGSSAQLAAMMYESMANVRMVHVPYKGLSPAMNDLLSGQVQLMFSSMVAIIPMVNTNRLRAIAVTGQKEVLFSLKYQLLLNLVFQTMSQVLGTDYLHLLELLQRLLQS
jgi:hypothetical protein